MKIPKNICNITKKKYDTFQKKYIKHANKVKNKSKKSSSQIKTYMRNLKHEWLNKTSVIPLQIIQYWHDKTNIPTCIKNSINTLKRQNPEFEFKLFDEKDAISFLRKDYSEKYVDIMNSLNAHALKADLFRYCYLYKYGGIYLDVKYYCINDFKLLYLTDKEYFCRDIPRSFSGIYNAFIICKPKNKILYKTIQQFIKNTENKYYGNNRHCIGPMMMKYFFSENELNNMSLKHDYINKTNRFISLHNYRIMKYNEDYRDIIKNHWSCYWYDKNLYNEKESN